MASPKKQKVSPVKPFTACVYFPLEAEQEVSLPHRLRDLLDVETPLFGLFVALRGVGRASGGVNPVHGLPELHPIPQFDARDVAPCLGI